MSELPSPFPNSEANPSSEAEKTPLPERRILRTLGTIVRLLSRAELALKLEIAPRELQELAEQEGVKPLTPETIKTVLLVQKKAEILRRLLRGRDASSATMDDLLALLDHAERAREVLSELPLSGSTVTAKIPRIYLGGTLQAATPGESPPLSSYKQIETLLSELSRYDEAEIARRSERFLDGDEYYGTDQLEDYFPELFQSKE